MGNEERSQPGCTAYNTYVSSIDLSHLPDLHLVIIIQHLPWLDRVRVERVNRRWRQFALSHGWLHTTRLQNWDDGENNYMEVPGLQHVLDRCGKHVESLRLCSVDLAGDVRGLVDRCPNLRDQVRLHSRDRSIKCLFRSFAIEDWSPEYTSRTNIPMSLLRTLLAECGTLEALKIRGLPRIRELKLPPRLLALTLRDWNRELSAPHRREH